jgi:hypothetical protein
MTWLKFVFNAVKGSGRVSDAPSRGSFEPACDNEHGEQGTLSYRR